jgi:hypothetical protein
VDLLHDADAHIFFALVESSIIIIVPLAPPSTSTLQPQIRLTKASTKQICFRWCLDVLVLPLDFDLESPLQPSGDGNPFIIWSPGVHLLQGSVDPTTTDALHGLPSGCSLYSLPPARSASFVV